MRSELKKQVPRFTPPRVPIARTTRLALAPFIAAMVFAGCSTPDLTSPENQDLGALTPRLASSSNGSGVLQVWHDGETFTLDSATRVLSSSSGLRVGINLELFPGVLSVFQGVVEGDVYSAALESILYECPRPEMCVDPYRLGGHGGNGGSGERVFQSGAPTSRGTGAVRIVVTGSSNGRPTPSGEVFTMTTDDCGDIAGAVLGTITSFRSTRGAWAHRLKQVLFDYGVGEAIAALPFVGPREAAAIGAGAAAISVGTDALYAHVNMGIMGTLWYSNNCHNQTVRATGFVMLPGSPPGSGGGGGGTDGIVTLYCTWKTEWVEIQGRWFTADVRVCSYHAS